MQPEDRILKPFHSNMLLEVAGTVQFIVGNSLFQLYAKLAATRSMGSATNLGTASKYLH
jgi:hypothetical protein